jgi:cyclase
VLKQRIIPKFLLDGERLVKFVRFHESRRQAGNPVSTAKVYDAYGVDEMIFLDIAATAAGRVALINVIERVAREVFMPLSVGGGIRSLDDVNELLRAGADKVSVTTAPLMDATFVRAAAQRFGDQCITVGVDYREVEPGRFRVFSHGGTQAHDHDPLDWARRMQDSNAGEIVLTSIDRDGTRNGYDCDLLQRAVELLEVPVIASGGAGSLEDCQRALATGVSGIAVSSMFFFTDHSPIKTRSFLRSRGTNVRASRSSRN